MNSLFFGNNKIANIGILNFFYDIVIFLCFFTTLIRKKYVSKNKRGIFLLLVLAVLLSIKILVSSKNGRDIFSWIVQKQYYILLCVLYIGFNKTKLDLKTYLQMVIKTSYIVCPLSIYMFLTSNYYGTVLQNDFLNYYIVGTPFARMFSVFGSPLSAGAYFAVIIVAITYVMDMKTFNTKLLLGLNLVCLILTFSRAGLIAVFAFALCSFLKNRELSGWKKIVAFASLGMALLGLITFLSNNGFYFWNINSMFDNPRILKWISSFQVLLENWFLGSDFQVNISLFNSWETTLSDNSILIIWGDFGLLVPTVMFILFCINSPSCLNSKKNNVRSFYVFIFIISFLYDFIQVFPANYVAVITYIFINNNKERTNLT